MSQVSTLAELPEAILKAENLPSPPSVAMEVLRLTGDDGVGIDDLAAVISRDPALSAKLLKLSNSSLFRRGAEVLTLDRATMVLGLKTVKLMALSFSLAGTLPRDATNGNCFNYQAYWMQSLTMAVAGRSLAQLVRSRNYDEAFMCGTAAEVVPVREVDDHPLGEPGEVTRLVQQGYEDAIYGRSPEYSEWLDLVGEPAAKTEPSTV